MREKKLKPKRLIDINPFLPKKINLFFRPRFRFPFLKSLKIILATLTVFLFLSGAQAPIISNSISSAQTSRSPEEERIILQQQLKELEKQMEDYQNQIEAYQAKGKSLKNEIAILNAKIQKLNLQIKAIEINLANLEKEINTTQKKINATEIKLANQKQALAYSLQSIYETDNKSLTEIVLAHQQISDFFRSLNNMMLVQQALKTNVDKIIKLREDLIDQKQELALEKTDVENLKAYQEAQKQNLATTKIAKDNLLKITKGKESEYQKLLKNTQETAAQIRSRIFELLGGGELTFEKAFEYARLAEQATGVKAALILAVLDRETLLGKNVGRCNYKEAMHPNEKPIFLDLTKTLNIDPESVTVSCPNQDGYYGGAMGPAQFLPSTWKKYQERISQITHHNPPSPWNNADAFVATALYLKDAGGDSSSLADQRAAAAKYYAGNRWQRYLWTYGDRVVTTAQRFQKDIDILTKNGS